MKRHSFTLVEMLLVLVITGILLALVFPAFERLSLGSGVDAAARMVGAQLRLARAYAISNRVRVALLMPRSNDPVTGRRFSAFRACQVDAANKWVAWIPNTKWEMLPAGAVIAEADTLPKCGNPTAEDGNTSYVTSVDTFSSQVRAIIFKPNGQLVGNVDADGKRYVSVVEGFYLFPAINCTIRNAKNLIDISVDAYTGRVSYE